MTEEQGATLDIKFQQRFSKNLLSNVVYFVLNVIIGLALVPFFLDTLGPAAYGLIPLATSLTSYITIFTDAVNGSISRYLTIDLQRSDFARANETYNTSLFGMLLIVLMCVPISILIAISSPSFFDIGDSAVVDVVLLFSLIFISVLLRAFGSTFMTTLFAYNRMDLRNIVNIVYQLIPVILIVSIFLIFGPSLVAVGTSYLLAAVISVFVSYVFSRKTCPQLKTNHHYFSKLRFKEMGGVTFWLIINRFGGLLVTNVSLIFVNILYGVVAETGYSLVLTFNILLVSIGSLITSILTPMIYSYYSKGDMSGLITFSKFSIKIVGLLIALPVGLVCIFSSQFLTLWVGSEYTYLVPLMWILIIPSLLEVQVAAIGGVNIACLRVRFPAIYAVLCGFFNIGLILLFNFLFDIGYYNVALSYLISRVILGIAIYTPIYIAYILGAPHFTFIKSMLYGYISLAGLLVVGIIFTSFISVDSLLMLIIAGTGFSIIYLLIILKLILKKNERDLIRSCIPKTIGKLIPEWIL
ncbi:MAG: oligosaccharide flippase family protein [Methanocorpusculum sp.]|uniref:oligosaccharide flippase family protein n=1 Tax=Methanocorpusculum sp. TaxID=2058474 RepID=UPI00271E4076|nr:oligosaccharide flippase family protein [Methanocorpusculum sp.]MDO9523800.1 oligosaccharide flippase family protein [Methanocorpusculum sp.]